MKRILLTTVVLAVVAAACGGGNSHSDEHMSASTSTSGATGAAAGVRTIDVTMVDIGYQPTALTVHRGDHVEFVFHNQGKIPHDAFIGDEAAQTEHEQAMHDMQGQGGITVQPGATGSLTYTFDKAGPVEIGCHQPGHYAAGMRVMVTVA